MILALLESLTSRILATGRVCPVHGCIRDANGSCEACRNRAGNLRRRGRA